MKVYVVYCQDGEEAWVSKVFLSQEKARTHVEAQNVASHEGWFLEEWEVEE
jgi:hypothetical protein